MLNRYNTSTATLEHDTLLKEVIESRIANKSDCYDWASVIPMDSATTYVDISFMNGGEEISFNPIIIAQIIGAALTDLMIAQGVEEDEAIFNSSNKTLVYNVTMSVTQSLLDKVQSDGQIQLSDQDLYFLIEKALIERNRYDIARSLVLHRRYRNAGRFPQNQPPISVRLIRRNNSVVPWNESKIEDAVRRAFLTVRENPEHAIHVARAVSNRVKASEVSQVNIEEVQDLVQSELMRLGHYRVAEHYILYRAQHARLRSERLEQEQTNSQQDSMIVITEEDGTTNFWDGKDLRKRIEFASAGLNLNLSAFEIESELRRSLNAEISRADLQKLIILNSKTLLEKDADFAKFSGRILLTFIYEEVLDWDILVDGREGLKKAHRDGFIKYLKYGVAINRLSADLLQYDLETIAEALDPSADLDFEFLGISTLYDRYLIVDKTKSKHQRLETPQFFWMRVALGLFKAEEFQKEEKAIRMYQLYKSRRFCSSTPTLFNSGTVHSQLSSCYLYKVDDSIESIMQRGIADNAYLSKWAGGLGGSWTAVRGMGAYIKGTNVNLKGLSRFSSFTTTNS